MKLIKLITLGILGGSGGTPEISVTGDTDFGSTPVGTPVSEVFTILNSGNGTLEITLPITIVGDDAAAFTVTVQPTETEPDLVTLAPGASTTFTVQADADVVDVFSADISIQSNAAGSPTLIPVEVDVEINYLAQFDFSVDDAAPMATPYIDADGQLLKISDTGNDVRVDTDGLDFFQFTAASTYVGVAADGSDFTNQSGLTFLFQAEKTGTSDVFIGIANSANILQITYRLRGVSDIRTSSSVLLSSSPSTLQLVQYALHINTHGRVLMYAKAPTDINWLLLFVYKITLPATLRSYFSSTAGIMKIFEHDVFVQNPIDPTRTLAPSIAQSIVADGDNSLIQLNMGTLEACEFSFRYADANNRFFLSITALGAVEFRKLVAGVNTLIASGTIASNQPILIRLLTNRALVWTNNTAILTTDNTTNLVANNVARVESGAAAFESVDVYEGQATVLG